MGPEAVGPLLTLADRLRSLGPSSLFALIARLGQAEEYGAFVALVREFLPECEGEIMRQPGPAGQIALFARRFEDRYFPLVSHFSEGMVDEYGELTRSIPAPCWGFSYDDYSPELRPGLLLMTCLLEPPSWLTREDDREEMVEEAVSEELIPRMPERGIPLGEAQRLLKGTPYEGLALWGEVLEHDTGTYFWDMTEEWAWEDPPPWEREVVEGLTREWHRAELIQQKAFDLAEWLEEDPLARLRELRDFMERRRLVLAGQLSLWDEREFDKC